MPGGYLTKISEKKTKNSLQGRLRKNYSHEEIDIITCLFFVIS